MKVFWKKKTKWILCRNYFVSWEVICWIYCFMFIGHVACISSLTKNASMQTNIQRMNHQEWHKTFWAITNLISPVCVCVCVWSVPPDQWRTHPSQWDFLRDVLTQIKSDCLPVWWKVFRHIKRGEGWDYSKRHETAKRNFKNHLVTLGDLTGGISGARSARGSHHHSTCKFLWF